MGIEAKEAIAIKYLTDRSARGEDVDGDGFPSSMPHVDYPAGVGRAGRRGRTPDNGNYRLRKREWGRDPGH